MQIFTNNDINNVLVGSTLLATGGGGPLEEAKSIADVSSVKVAQFSDFSPTDKVFTAFGVGGKVAVDPVESVKKALNTFEELYNFPLVGIIPVEIGPLSTASAFFLANQLDVPLIDADIVGFRSSPEIFLETISLKNLRREPCVISNGKDVAVLAESSSYQFTEKFLRSFANLSGGEAYVIGYFLDVKDLEEVVGIKSISFAKELGKDLICGKKEPNNYLSILEKYDFKSFGEGIIVQEEKKVEAGYTTGKYVIKTSTDIFEIYYKNENIVMIKNGYLFLTVPDLIVLFDPSTYLGLNNYDVNLNKRITICAKRSIPIWRTDAGLKLFSPRNIGLEFDQKVFS